MNARLARSVVAVVTLLSGTFVLAGPRPLAVVGGLLLGFVLPGLALTPALFHGRTLTPIERAMVAPAVSLAALVSSGLIIYTAGYALDKIAWTSATVLVTIVALVVPVRLPRLREFRWSDAWSSIRSRRRPAVTPDAPTALLPAVRDDDPSRAAPPAAATAVRTLPKPVEKPPLGRIARQLIPMVLVVALLGTAGWLSFVSSRHSYDVTITALSAAPPQAVEAGRRAVVVTASGLVPGDGPYSIVATDPDGNRVAQRTVTVPANRTWTGTLSVGRERTTIGLFRAGDTTAYRTLYIAGQP